MWNRDKTAASLLFVGLLVAVYLLLAQQQPAPGPHPTPVDPVKNVTGKWVIVLRDIDNPTAEESAVLDGVTARAMKNAERMIIRPLSDPWVKEKGYDAVVTRKATVAFSLNELGQQVGEVHYPSTEEAFAKFVNSTQKEPPGLTREFYRSEQVSAPGPDHFEVKKDDQDREYVLVDGHRRLLTAKPSANRMQGLPKFSDFNTLIPPSKWRDIERRDFYKGSDWIIDQDGIGECVGCGWAGAMRRVRKFEGSTDVKLSPAFVYAHINGDVDQGAIISDGIAVAKNQGTCSYHTLGIEPFYMHQLPEGSKAEAKRFRAHEIYRCDEWNELCSAIQAGFVPVYGYMVGNNFSKWDKYGVAGHDRGPGNHCNCAGDGMKKLPDGRWAIIDVNSWGSTWGPFKDGRVLLDEKHLFANGDMPDVCVIRSMYRDPQDPVNPPALRVK